MSKWVRIGGAAAIAACAGLFLNPAVAAAQPILTPEPGGAVKVEAPPGEWWKCSLYSPQPAKVVGLPPVVNYSNNSEAWKAPGADSYSTPTVYAQFAPGQDVVADCASQYLPVLWVQHLKTVQ